MDKKRNRKAISATHTHTPDLWSVHQWLCIFLFLVFHASSNHCKIFNEKQQQRTDIPTHLHTQIKNVNHFWITAMMTCYMCVSVYAFSAIAAAASVCFLTSLFPCYVSTDKLTSQCTICIYIAIQNLFLLSIRKNRNNSAKNATLEKQNSYSDIDCILWAQ